MAHAGSIKGPNEFVKAENFFDWNFAQHVWFDLKTDGEYDAEFDKYASHFKPWLEIYKNDPRKALTELKTYPEAKRRNIERAYDMQLAFDQWADQLYVPWYKGFRNEALNAALYRKVPAQTFDDWLAKFGKNLSCIPTRSLTECGPVPDWRSKETRAREENMMRAALDEAQKREQQRKK